MIIIRTFKFYLQNLPIRKQRLLHNVKKFIGAMTHITLIVFKRQQTE